ncbi:hypothetical protein RJT34_03635 [Clitoria ternatea]|uniref:Retroviral polymerase SH3-like domain-containing protein n=1 Tax=Clitoria ternatea TaxID=43366 RepID=A0AAN9KK57_CLITE
MGLNPDHKENNLFCDSRIVEKILVTVPERDATSQDIFKRKRDKLDKRALAGIFIGYSTFSKAYKIFQPQNGKMVISRDVHFVEDEEWNWDDTKKTDLASTDVKFKFSASDIEQNEDESWQNELVDDAPILKQQRKIKIGWLQ